jgi:hypothetical protein
MRNIHILPTEKPSRLIKSKINDTIVLEPINVTNNTRYWEYLNIYITSDEKIKEGDWITDCEFDIMKLVFEEEGDLTNWKKIILTTDPKLIADGVQAIDDDFLEWFVKNPSCEKVEIYRSGNHYDGAMEFYHPLFYNTIIPKQDFILVKEDIKLIGEEPTITITLNKEEARGLLACIMRTHASGTDLDVGEMVEDKLVEFLNS